MEKKVFYRPSQPKIFIWIGSIAFILLVSNLFYNKGIINTNSIFLFSLSILYLAQHFSYKTWVLKMDEENIYTRNLFLFRVNKIPFADIISHKVLITGDLEIKFKDEDFEISKDEISKADFQEILDKINQVTQ